MSEQADRTNRHIKFPCQPNHRCIVCRLLEEQVGREREVFDVIVSQDASFATTIEELSSLFRDAA